MENLLTYILQVNLLLALIYLGYHFLLKGLTFYNLNRVYFIVGSLYAFAYPFIDIKAWFAKNEVIESAFIPEFLPSFEMPDASTNQITLLDFLIAVIGVLAVILVVKLLIQLISLLRIHLHSKNSSWHSYIFRNVVFPIVPFSFFNKIYIHKAQHQDTELQDIFAHEIVHVRGHHTVDVLLFEIILVVCWYNPFIWLMRKAVRQNLEFLTDQQVLNKGVDKQTYQYSLLHVTRQGVAVDMSNHFNFKTLKKRIMMMNKKRSSKLELSKYAFLLPVFLIAGMSFTVSEAENNIEKIVEKSQQTTVISEPLNVKLKGEVSELLKNTIGTDVIVIDTAEQEKEYPLLAPNFDRKDLDGKNLHFVIDGELVSLDEFLEFPRKEINGVDIYKDKEEIRKKIGKENSEGLFVLTSKNKKLTQADVKRLKGKSEIDAKKKFIYDYDGKILTKNEFLAIAEENLKQLTQMMSRSILKGKYSSLVSNWEEYDGVIHAISPQGEGKLKEQTQKALYIVDGVELGFGSRVIDGISPNNIKSINVIKGPDALLIYGAKGKEGIIEVITKDGAVASGKKVKGISAISFQADSSIYTKNRIVFKGVQSLGFNNATPLIILEGKEIDPEQFKLISPNNIESISVLRDQSATALYGDKGKDGVIIVASKKVADSDKKIKEFSGLSVKDGGKNIDAIALTRKVGDDASLVDKNMTFLQPNKPVITIKGKVMNSEEKPLIIIDGKETDLSSINPNDIASMDILKNEAATSLYGDKGKNGVIMIKMKDNKDKEVVVTGYKADNPKKDSIKITPNSSNKEVKVTGYKK
jgi:TonB-dependent SusC/RagA subfamily outer membrane receptor